MTTSISVAEDTRNQLQILKMKEGYSSVDELLRTMLVQYRKQRFLEASSKFRKAMDRKGLKPEDLFE